MDAEVDTRAWPGCNSEMAERIRSHDWAATSLGPIESWPERLKGVVDVVLTSGFPMVALCGPDLVQIYNDGYCALMGAKHPAGLGQPTRECWPEVWHINEPIYERVWSGETLTFEDKPYPLARHGTMENAWLTLSYSPMRAEDGGVMGVLVTVFETTARHQAEAALRDREAVERARIEAALHQSQTQLQFALEAAAMGTFVWHVAEDQGEPDRQMLALFGQPSDGALTLKAVLQTMIHPEDRDRYAEAVARATSPRGTRELREDIRVLLADGSQRWLAITARTYFDEQTGQPTKMAGVAFDITQRKEIEQALHASEERYRTLFESMAQGFCILQLIFDENEKLIDCRYIEINPVFEHQSGIKDALGRTIRELVPDIEPFWFDTYGKVALTGEPTHFVDYAKSMGRWFEVYAMRIGEPRDRQVAVLFNDITARKQDEERQALLVLLGDTLRPLSDPREIQRKAARVLRAHLRASRVLYFEASGEDELICAVSETAEGMPTMAGQYRISDYSREVVSEFQAGRITVREDVASDQNLTPAEKAAFAALRINAWASAPLVKDGRLMAMVTVHFHTMHTWSTGELMLLKKVTERTWLAVEHARAEAALRESEERLRLIVENARDYAILVTDPSDVITDWFPGAAAVFGWRSDEIIGQPGDVLFTPEDRKAGVPRWEVETARSAGMAPDVRWHLRKDGGRVFIDGQIVALYHPDHTPRGFLKIGQDVTERRAAEEQLERSEALFRTLATGIQQLVFLSGPDGFRTWGSPQWCDYTGISFEDSLGFNWLKAIHPDDWELTRQRWADAAISGEFYAEHRILHASDGAYRWHQTRARPLDSRGGAVSEWVGASTDVHDLRQLQEEQGVLVAELQHRTRNLIGVVRSLVDRTVAGSASLEDFKDRFRDRIAALARVQGLLSRKETGQRITFDDLIRTALSGLGVINAEGQGAQVTLEGPSGVRLRTATVQTFALGLHELATNALKYGALSRPEGRLVVRWTVSNEDDGERRLRVSWEESGVPMPLFTEGRPLRKGYGRELIERALPYQLKAETRYELTPEGVRCTITLPISSTPRKARDA